MEDPVSPATRGAELLWDADSDASSELSDIYGDLEDRAVTNSEAEDVDDADIFQELGRIADEERQLSSCRPSSEAQGNPVLQNDVFSQNQRKEDCQNEQSTSELTHGKATPSVLDHNLPQAEDLARKEFNSEVLINNSAFVCGNGGGEVLQDDSSVNTQKKAKKKHTRDSTKKSVEGHSKKKGKSHHITHKDVQIKTEKETDSLCDNSTDLQLGASQNKDLQFVLSHVIKKSKCSIESRENDLCAKNNYVSKDQHSLLEDGRKENSSEGSGHSLSSSREEIPSSKEKHQSAASEDKTGEKGKVLEMQEGKPSDGRSSVRKVATVAEELHTEPRPASTSEASASVVQNIMMMAKLPSRSTAADFMDMGHASATEKRTSSYRIPKKNEKEMQNNQLDLYEDLLVGQGRDELLQEIKKLKAEHEQLQESLHSSQQRCLGLEKDNETLLNNMSSLWKTSIFQLRQKANEVITLKREKEAIIFRRALRQVPKDELDRVVSHIAAYNKEELKEFINSLNEEKEEKECTCSRSTKTPVRTGTVAQRVRQATRGVRLSPSSDSEAQTLKNLLGKKGETVTHSEEKLRTWSMTRASFRSQKCLFSRKEEEREDVRPKPEVTKSVWNRLGRSDLDRKRTDIENERSGISTKEEKHKNESRDASNRGDHSRYEKSSSGKEKGSRKSVFSRLGIKRTITNEEENANTSADVQLRDECLDVKRGPSKDAPNTETPLEKIGKVVHVKKGVELSDQCMEKIRPVEEPEDKSLEDRIPSSFKVCSSSESIDAPHSTTMKQESLGVHLSKDRVPPAQQSGGGTGVPLSCEEEMLSKTLFGQRMKNKLKNLGKSHPPIEQDQTLSSPSGPDVHNDVPQPPVETTPTHRHTRQLDKTKTTTSSLRKNVKKAIFVESKTQSEDKVTIRSDKDEIKQDLNGNDKQGDGPTLEKDSKRLKKKQSSVCKENSYKEKEPKKTVRENCQEIQEDNVEQVEGSSKRQSQSAADDDIKKNAKALDNEMKALEWNDIDSKEMDGAILCLAKLRSVFNNEGENIKSKKEEKNKHFCSLFGDDEDLSEDDDELIDNEESKDQDSEIHGRTSDHVATPDDHCTKRKLENKEKNVDSTKKVTDLHSKVENIQKLQMDNVQAGDCENKQKQGPNSDQEGDSEDADAKEYPKRRESSKTAHQAQRSEDDTEKMNRKSVRKEKKKKSLKNVPEVDVQTESKSRDRSQATLRSGEDNSSVCEVKHRKHQTKDRTKKVKSEARKHKDLDTQNMEEQTKKKTNLEKNNESKKTSLDMKQKSGKSEQETNTKETQDIEPSEQNTDEKRGMTASKENTKKKPVALETNDKEKSSDTTERNTLQQKQNDGQILNRTPTPVLEEEMRSSGDEDEDDGEIDVFNRTPVQSPVMENVSEEHEALNDTKQQEQSDGKEMRDAEGEEKSMKSNPKKNPDENIEGRTMTVIEDEDREGDCSDITHDRNDECLANVRKEREAAPQDTMSSIDDQDNDILQSLLGTNYNEDSLFLSDEELLYEDGCENEDEEEEEKEERNSVHDQKPKLTNNSKNDHRESRMEEERKLKTQTESKELNEKTDRVHDVAKKASITESTNSPRRSARERGQDTPKTKPHRSNDGLDDINTTPRSVKRQSRRDTHTPKTGERKNSSRSPSRSLSPEKGNLSKSVGGRIKKLFSSTSSRRQQGKEEGVSPLMAREERLQSKRTEKQEPLSKRAEKQEQQSKRVEKQESHKRSEKQELQSRRGERQESRHSKDETDNLRPKDKDRRKNAEEHSRKRESHSPHVLSSQNRKSPPRLRKSRKRERSESEVSGKKDWSPRKKGERSSPRKREPREDNEEPANKKRRVSVKSRLTLPPNSDEENMKRPVRWQPSTPETERTRRISSRLKNQPHVADERTRESAWQGTAQHTSKTPDTQRKSSPNSVPVDSKLLRSILTQSPSKYMEQEDEKEEGELDEDEEEGEVKDICSGKPVRNHERNEKCDLVNKNDDFRRQPLKPKEHNSNMEDKEKTMQTKEHKPSKHNTGVDSRNTQDGKSCETDKHDVKVDTDKKRHEQKNADSKTVISDRPLDSKVSPERAQYTACGTEEQNNPRSSKKRGESEKEQCSQTQPSPPRTTSPVQDAVQHQDMKIKRKRRRTLEYPSENRKEDEDPNRKNCTAVDDNATFFPGEMFQLIQPKVRSHLPPDLSVSSISSVSDDTIDLMVKQHNENFPSDLTNGSDDSETSLLKYIAISEDDECNDNEAKGRSKGNDYVVDSDNDSCDEDKINDGKVKRTQPENIDDLETKEMALSSNTRTSKRKTQLMDETEQVSPHDKVLDESEHSMITEDSNVAMLTHKEVTTTKATEKTSQQYYKDTSESLRCGSESVLSYSSTSSESKSPVKCDSENVSLSSSASSESRSPVRCESQNVSSSSSASSESKSPVRCESQNMSSSSNTSDSSTATERQDTPLHPAVCTTRPSNNEEEDIRGTTVCQTNTTEADMDEQDQLTSSDDEDDSELDIENTGSENDEHTERATEDNCGTTSTDDQHFTRGENEDEAVVEDLPSETKSITETEKADNEANKSDDSDSDSDCECSECNSSSSSSSSSSGSSSSSSSSDSSSSDSEMEDAPLDGVEDLEKSLPGAERNSVPVDHITSELQSCEPESSEAVMAAAGETASPTKLVSPTKFGCKTPKKTPRKPSSKTHMMELSESSGSMGAFKKTPKKSPCKKSPCKKSVRTPKAKRVHPSRPASTEKQSQDASLTSPEKSGHFHSLFEPASEEHKTSQIDLDNSGMQTSHRWSLQQSGGTARTRHNDSTPQSNSDLPVNKNIEKQKASTPSDPFISKTFLLKKKISPLDPCSSISKTYVMKKSKVSAVSLTSTPQTNSDLSLNKTPGKQKASTPSDPLISKTYQLKQKISPLDASSSISKTYVMKSKVSPVPLTSTAPSMPFVETADVPGKRSASFGPSPGHTTQLSCTDSNNVISVVHTNKKSVTQVPKKTSSRTPKKVTQEEKVTTTTAEKTTAKKRRLTPTSVMSNIKNPSGKKIRMIAPAMYEGVSPRKLFPRADKINQGRNSPLLSSPGSSVDSPEPTKASISTDIVVPVKVRRAKRQLNLGLSSSPVEHIYTSKQSLGHGDAAHSGRPHGDISKVGGGVTPAQQKTGDTSGQVLRRSPRKPRQSYKLTM